MFYNFNYNCTIINNNSLGKPSLKNANTIQFEGGKTFALKSGETANINEKGEVEVTLKDGKTKIYYDKSGNEFNSGVQIGQESANSGVQVGQESANSGVQIGQESANSGVQVGQESANLGV